MIRKILIFFVFLIALVILPIFYCSSNINNLFNAVVSGDKENFDESYAKTKYCFGNNDLLSNLPRFLSGKYLVLLQNNYELRPTGGFMGSYAIITFEGGVLKNWEVQDIYTPDGQIEGHVPPLVPFQQAFKTGDWRLPNSNWNPNFPDAVDDMLWFFAKGGVGDIDGVIAVNFELFEKLIQIVGPFKPYDFDEEVNIDNFYELAQGTAEDNFFPGSRAKKNYLSGVATTLFDKIPALSIIQKLKVVKLLLGQLSEGQILLWNKDVVLQNQLSQYQWTGELLPYTFDYFYLVEANLGVNKANCCIEREIIHQITTGDVTTNSSTIVFKNNSDVSVNRFSGDYYNYQRILIPSTAQVKSVKVGDIEYTKSLGKDRDNPPALETDYEFEENIAGKYKSVGFWVVVPVATRVGVAITYELKSNANYSLVTQFQPGVYSRNHSTIVNPNE